MNENDRPADNDNGGRQTDSTDDATTRNRLDTDVTFSEDGRGAEMIVFVDLSEAEATRLWDEMEDGHCHPDNARARVLTALGYEDVLELGATASTR